MNYYLPVLLFAILVRFVWIFFLAPYFPNALGGAAWTLNTGVTDHILGNNVSPDFNQVYDPGARGIMSGDGFTDQDGNLTAYVGPGYSFFVATIFSIFGINLIALRVVQIFVDVATCFFTGLIGKKLFGKKIGQISMMTYAIYPFAFYQSGLLISEVLCTFLTAISFYLILKAYSFDSSNHASKKTIILIFLSAIFLGLSSLVRPNTLPLIVSFGIFLFFSAKKPFKESLIFLSGVSIVVLPWIIRNYLLFDQFIPISSIVYSAYQDVDGSVQSNIFEVIYKKISIIFNSIDDTFSNLMRFFTVWYTTSSGLLDRYLIYFQIPFLVLLVTGFIFGFKRNYLGSVFSVLSAVIFISVLVFIAKNALARYTVPILPIIIPFVALSLHIVAIRFMSLLKK